MSELNPRNEERGEINVQRVFWVTFIYTIVALSSLGFMIFTFIRLPSWQSFAMIVLSVISVALYITSLVIVRRDQAKRALIITFLVSIITNPISIVFFKGTTIFLAAMLIVTALINIYFLFPETWPKPKYLIALALAVGFMLLVEWINPPFRLEAGIGGTETVNFGPVLTAFIVLSVIFILVRQAWAAGQVNISLRLTLLILMVIVPVMIASEFFTALRGADFIEAQRMQINQIDTYVVDDKNQVVAQPDSALPSEVSDLSDYPPVVMLRDGQHGLVTFTDEEGQEWQANIQELDNGWGLITQQKESDPLGTLPAFRITSYVTLIIAIIIIAVAVWFIVRRTVSPLDDLTKTAEAVAAGDFTRTTSEERQDEFGVLARAFNTMTSQLRELIGSLEQRIAERTRALETSTEVGRQLSTILDQRELVREVVEQVRSAFDYYHTHIYLFDEDKERLLMVGGTGEAGRTMLEQAHSIPKGRGLVGRTADTNIPVLVPSVERTIGFEIVTNETVEEVTEREGSQAVATTWYANLISAHFIDLQAFAQHVAQKKASSGRIPQLGYILYGLNDFLETMKRGAEEAAQFLGVEVEVASADFDPDRGIRLFREMLAKGKDGLIVTPHFPEKWVEPIQEAVEAGIPVLTANLRCPGSAASAWFGQDSYQSGLILARELEKALVAAGKTSGEIVVASAREIQELHERYTGLKRGLRDTDYTLSEFYGVGQDEQINLAGWEEVVHTHPDMIAAVGLASMDLPSLIRIKKQINAAWIAGGYDLTEEITDAIRDGLVQVSIAQHPYLQGYLPVLALTENLMDGTPLEGWIVDNWQANPLLPHTRAEVAVPISVGENVLGVLDVQEDKVNGLSENDAELLTSIANQVAVALQNAQAYQRTQQQVAREALIANINQQIQSTTEVDEALQVTVRELGRVLGLKTSVHLATKSNGKERK